MSTDFETMSFFPATRDNAEKRLKAFIPNMGKVYAKNRNADLGAENRSNVSCLSPYHAHRLLFEKETVAAALKEHGLTEAEKFIQEVYWRTYFKGWLEHRPTVWQRYKSAVESKLTNLDDELRTRLDKAMAGETGIACFDAWAKELVETGYLHNHTRMWFASIWVFTLQLPWTLGADFFYRHLLDGDAASNTLSWRWVAGLHTPGKNYLATAENIARNTDGRFNPVGELNENAAPLEDDWNGSPAGMPDPVRPEGGVPSILLLHEDDLGYDSLSLEGLNIVAIAGATVTDDRSPLGVSETVKRFTIEAAEDALSRANEDLFVPTVKLASPEGLVDLAKEHGAKQVISGYVPVGPVRDRLSLAKPTWDNAGLAWTEILRDYDQAAWPHATKGFFKLKETIPDLVRGFTDE